MALLCGNAHLQLVGVVVFAVVLMVLNSAQYGSLLSNAEGFDGGKLNGNWFLSITVEWSRLLVCFYWAVTTLSTGLHHISIFEGF